MDAATALTLQYLKAIEQEFPVTRDAIGNPICVIEDLLGWSPVYLRKTLKALFESPECAVALEASKQYGKQQVQTLAFGLADDFDKLIKLGLLCGTRTVLWDVLLSRYLRRPSWDQDQAANMAAIVCGLLTLRPIVERGGIVILPHPTQWSEKAKNLRTSLGPNPHLHHSMYGLAMAIAAIDDGLTVHPYTLATNAIATELGKMQLNFATQQIGDPKFTASKVLTSLLADARFAWLEHVTADDFHIVLLNHPEAWLEINNYFVAALASQTPLQQSIATNANIEKLFAAISARNKSIANFAVDGAGASMAVSALTFGPAFDLSSLTLSAGFAGTASLISVIQKLRARPSETVILQIFEKLADVQQFDSAAAALSPVLELNDWNMELDPDIQGHLEKFDAFRWTEDKHDYLESLPDELAAQIVGKISEDTMRSIMTFRHRQQDYIGDYLEYLWNLDGSEPAYWDHITAMFESEEGLLIADTTEHMHVMESYEMPIETWNAMLDSIVRIHGVELTSQIMKFELESLGPIFLSQTSRPEKDSVRRVSVLTWINAMDEKIRPSALWYISTINAGSLPAWILVGEHQGSK